VYVKDLICIKELTFTSTLNSGITNKTFVAWSNEIFLSATFISIIIIALSKRN